MNSIRFLFLIALGMGLSACKVSPQRQPIDQQDHGVLMVDFSTGFWNSYLNEKSGDVGLYIRDQNYWEKVPAGFVANAASSAKLFDGSGWSSLTVTSQNTEQAPDPEQGVSHLQPVEIVFDGSKLASSGWNVISVGLTVPAQSGDFLESSRIESVFRLDSAPSVVGVRFTGEDPTSEVFTDITIYASEPIQPVVGADVASAFSVKNNSVDVECDFDENTQWPAKSPLLRCKSSVSSTVSIVLKDGVLEGTSGVPLKSIKGDSFDLIVSVPELPRNLSSAHLWRPVPPGS